MCALGLWFFRPHNLITSSSIFCFVFPVYCIASAPNIGWLESQRFIIWCLFFFLNNKIYWDDKLFWCFDKFPKHSHICIVPYTKRYFVIIVSKIIVHELPDLSAYLSLCFDRSLFSALSSQGPVHHLSCLEQNTHQITSSNTLKCLVTATAHPFEGGVLNICNFLSCCQT